MSDMRSMMWQRPTGWRWFPFAMMFSILIVFTVNAGMVYLALHSFPGSAGEDGFELSNAYGRVIDISARQVSLGWRVQVSAGAGSHAVVHASDRDGAPLHDVAVVARAERPLGPKQETLLALHPVGEDTLVSTQALASGRWTILLTLTRQTDTLTMTEHLVVP